LTRLRSQAARSDIAAGERKAVSKGGLLLQRAAGAHQSIDPQLAKAGGGEQRAHATQLQMPSPGRVYRPGDELTNGSLGTISIFSPARRGVRRKTSARLGFNFGTFARLSFGRSRLGTQWRFGFRSIRAGSPGEPLFAGTKAREVAAANRAAVGSGAQPQHPDGPDWGAIILLAPGGQFLAITARATRVPPPAVFPHAGKPTRAATGTAKWINPE